MKKIAINKLNFRFFEGNDTYFLIYNDDKIIIKRVTNNNDGFKEEFIIDILNYVARFKIIPNRNLSILEIDSIINNIFKKMREQSILKDAVNLDEIEKIVKNNYINILISNGTISLSGDSLSVLNKDNFLLDICLNNNVVIGTIKYDNGKIDVDVKDNYKKDALKLFNDLVLLLLEEKETKRLMLGNNSL